MFNALDFFTLFPYFNLLIPAKPNLCTSFFLSFISFHKRFSHSLVLSKNKINATLKLRQTRVHISFSFFFFFERLGTDFFL